MAARKIRNIGVGEFIVSSDYNDVLYTCIGSCVAVSLYDDINKIAGIVHIVLPGHRSDFRTGDRNAFCADTGSLFLFLKWKKLVLSGIK